MSSRKPSQGALGSRCIGPGCEQFVVPHERGGQVPSRSGMLRIAVVSDTHGLLRPELAAFVQGSDLIFHAGDVGKGSVLDQLRALAPLKVVKGNVDIGSWAQGLPSEIIHELEDGALRIYMTHRWQDVPESEDHRPQQLIIVGHSHKPELSLQENGAIKLNPGSCGARRFKLPVSAARLNLKGGELAISIHDLLGGKQLFHLSQRLQM